jgi:protein-S-isoprenylcysteine O-methyltransferase Ste14
MYLFKASLKKFNNLPLFDAALWPRRELLAQIAGSTACLVFLVHRFFRFEQYTGAIPGSFKVFMAALQRNASFASISLGRVEWHWIMWFSVWLIETGILVGYIMAFASRTEAKAIAKGFMEVVFPLIIAGLPMIIVWTPMNFMNIWPDLMGGMADALASSGSVYFPRDWETVFFLFLTLILLGGALNLAGLLTLRKAFTITSEARVFIRHGIFSIIRHPLYAGHFIMFFGYLLFHLHWYTVVLYVAFITGQYGRARIEEKKLLSVFPEYIDYMQTTGMFFPKIFNKIGLKVHT